MSYKLGRSVNSHVGETPQPTLTDDRRQGGYSVVIPVVLALLMAAPSIRGGFLSGDDIQLVRDHVLVNHPSFEHLRKLFAIPHRDLYQPVPLATFALNFAVLRWLGPAPSAEGAQAGAWLFHLTNVLIHVLNAGLVWRLVRSVTGRKGLALVAASLFAVHPLNVECVAWLNGRMMMLSTTFTLASLVAAQGVLERPGVRRILLTLLAVVLAMMSKVSVGLPVLLLLIPFVQRRRPAGRWWVIWVSAVVITGFFAVLNLRLSRGQLDTGAEVLEGSRLVRTVLALGWYVQRYFIPVGLAPWHPTEKVVDFSHLQFPSAVVVVAALLLVTVLFLRYSRTGTAGIVWFFATVAVTLPFVPSRNLMAAERYAYLPAIGFHWIIAVGCVQAVAALRRRSGTKAALPLTAGISVLAFVTLLGLSWKTTGYYRDNVTRCRRTAELYPAHAGVWTRLAWAHYDAGEYQQAVETADLELQHHPEHTRSDVWQVQGLSLLRAGEADEAVARIEAAVQIDPAGGMAHVRLATALAEIGRLDDAVRHYRRAVEILPNYNPGIIGLAQTYRKLGRLDEAAEMFEKALTNNPYDPLAAAQLAEMELAAGRTQTATARLEKLLHWMPENAGAHSNLGLGYLRSGRIDDALREYRAALALDPKLVPPRLNLAALLAQRGAAEEAGLHFRRAAEHCGYTDPEVLLPYSDFLIAQRDLRGAAGLWTRALERKPSDTVLASWYAWVCVLAEQWEPARQVRRNLGEAGAGPVAATLVGIMLDVHAGTPESAACGVLRLCQDQSAEGREVRVRLQQALEAYAGRHAENPWPHYLIIMMRQADGRIEGARSALQAFEQVCTDAEWIARARLLLARPASHPVERDTPPE
ncbi:MAG: tetratricopeptide repeat protein [Planctomycetota bacterium]